MKSNNRFCLPNEMPLALYPKGTLREDPNLLILINAAKTLQEEGLMKKTIGITPIQVEAALLKLEKLVKPRITCAEIAENEETRRLLSYGPGVSEILVQLGVYR